MRYKYFDFHGTEKIIIIAALETPGEGSFEIKTSPDGEVLGKAVINSNIKEWTTYEIDVKKIEGVLPLYFIYRGSTTARLLSFEII